MFPDTTNSASLNYTLIDTMIDMMNEQDDITLGFVFDPYVSEQIGYGNGQGMQQQPYSPQQIQDAISQGVPQEFIDQMTGGSSFNQGSSISSLDEFTNSIAGVESGANYGALGPVINNNGMYQGQRAMGKYQIMPGNLASVSGNQNGWDIQAMGRPVSPAEFMNSPQIQETIARYQINQLYQQYGNWQDVASAWHSGRPLSEATAAGAQDANITTANYVENVMNYA